MFLFTTSLLLAALYLTSPGNRKVPHKSDTFSFTDYRNRLRDTSGTANINVSGHSSVKRPTQAKIIPFKRPSPK